MAVKRFKRKVDKAQRVVRRHLAITRARYELLELQVRHASCFPMCFLLLSEFRRVGLCFEPENLPLVDVLAFEEAKGLQCWAAVVDT